MNSATPLYGHPFAYPGIILEEGHLRTLKVTALWFIDVDTRDSQGKCENTSASTFTSQFTNFELVIIYLCCTFVSCHVSHVSFHIFDVCNIQVDPMHDNIGVSSTKVQSKYLDSDTFFIVFTSSHLKRTSSKFS